MVRIGGLPMTLTLSSSNGSPNPLALSVKVFPKTVSSPERLPIGTSAAAIAARSKRVKVRA